VGQEGDGKGWHWNGEEEIGGGRKNRCPAGGNPSILGILFAHSGTIAIGMRTFVWGGGGGVSKVTVFFELNSTEGKSTKLGNKACKVGKGGKVQHKWDTSRGKMCSRETGSRTMGNMA